MGYDLINITHDIKFGNNFSLIKLYIFISETITRSIVNNIFTPGLIIIYYKIYLMLGCRISKVSDK
jgi:hypothetical protein